jgi:hypothetical protein
MGELRKTKKKLFVSICIVLLVCTAVAANVGVASAAKAGYTATSGTLTSAVTLDGKWTTPTEWNDAASYPMAGGLNGVFRLKWDMASDYSYIYQYFLIEIPGDTTSNANDAAIICEACAPELFGTPSGGTTPKTDCFKFEVNGTYPTATVTVYKGTGTAWAPFTAPAGSFTANVSLSASALSATPHKIIEFKMDSLVLALNPETWVLAAGYDASHGASGVQVWPDGSSMNSPNDYALLNSLFEPIPETFGIVIVLGLACVAVLVGSRYLRKPKAN